MSQDPGVRSGGSILTTLVSVPWEELDPGPVGHRVVVVDYDATTGKKYEPALVDDELDPDMPDDKTVLGDPRFHARNVYALVMRTLKRFEFALGRRVSWGFFAHQLKVVPHAFEEMNAFYSREAEALVFGYYRTERGVSFTCLSHDVVVHETSHALLDGLRYRFMAPSSADQAAFHEAFGDIVALLSVFSLEKVLLTLLGGDVDSDPDAPQRIRRDRVDMDSLMHSVLLGLAEEMGAASGQTRARALRRSVAIDPDEGILDRPEFIEPHHRGEILVAAVMRSFVDVWTRRLEAFGSEHSQYVDLKRVAEEGATIAEVLLTMAIRAIDYTPPIHLEFGDYLSALLTADVEVRPDDSRYGLRATLLGWFKSYGIEPASEAADGTWDAQPRASELEHTGVRFQSLQSDPIEMFSLLWANRSRLQLDPNAYTRVASLRPSLRISPDDGLPLRETVAECTQFVQVKAADLGDFGLKAPDDMPADQEVKLEGGSTLVLDEYGKLKYEIFNRLPSKGGRKNAVVQRRLEYLWNQGAFDEARPLEDRLAALHRRRLGLTELDRRTEVW